MLTFFQLNLYRPKVYTVGNLSYILKFTKYWFCFSIGNHGKGIFYEITEGSKVKSNWADLGTPEKDLVKDLYRMEA